MELELGCPVPPSIEVVYAKRRSRPAALIEEITVGEYCGVPAGNVRLIDDRQSLHMFGLTRARVVSNDFTTGYADANEKIFGRCGGEGIKSATVFENTLGLPLRVVGDNARRKVLGHEVATANHRHVLIVVRIHGTHPHLTIEIPDVRVPLRNVFRLFPVLIGTDIAVALCGLA